MNFSRPIPKELLKKMFLKTLYEFRPGGAYASVSGSWSYIIRMSVSEHFKIDPPISQSNDEIEEGYRAVFELERDGYIMQNPNQTEGFKILTKKGRAFVEQSLDEMKLPSIDIDQLLSRDDLQEKVRDDFLSSDYETAIFKAFRLLEETVRAKANESADSIGADLMSKAFKPKIGSLKHPRIAVSGEEEGLHHLMRGAIMLLKNPTSHRTVNYQDEYQAAHILAFANYLLDLVDECCKR